MISDTPPSAPKPITASLCQLGATAPNPVLTTLRYFRDEYRAHVDEKRCPAGVCKALVTYSVVADACTGCGACKKKCPADAISGEPKAVHEMNPDSRLHRLLSFALENAGPLFRWSQNLKGPPLLWFEKWLTFITGE